MDDIAKTAADSSEMANEHNLCPTGFNIQTISSIQDFIFTGYFSMTNQLDRNENNTFFKIVFDIGSQRRVGDLWKNYYPGCNGLIYVVDSVDVKCRMEETKKMLMSISSK